MRNVENLKELHSLYRSFTAYSRRKFQREIHTFTGVNARQITPEIAKAVYDSYYRLSFSDFCLTIKGLFEANDVFGYFADKSSEAENVADFIEFLVSREFAAVTKKGRVKVSNKTAQLFPKTLTEKEIRKKIESCLGRKVRPKKPVTDLFVGMRKFSAKAKYDQLPISQASAIKEVSKILEYMPFYGKFLFVGDDDFVSILLGMVNPKIEVAVHDIDRELLDAIKTLSKKFSLRVATFAADFQKKPTRKGKFVGFLCNPPYTERGVKKFMEYGVRYLGLHGGTGHLIVGDEAIGNRFLFLQKFFSRNNLVIKELTPGAVVYPFTAVHEEDYLTTATLSKFVDEKVIALNPRLGASLYVLEHVPFPVKRVNTKQPFYAYL